MRIRYFNKVRKNLFYKNVLVKTYQGTTIIGKYIFDKQALGTIFINDIEVPIKVIKSIVEYEDVKVYKYVFVSYVDTDYEKLYCYKTTIEDIKEGDIVLVDRQGELVQALVEKISYYSEETVPYPLSLTKNVLEVVTKDYDCVDTNL